MTFKTDTKFDESPVLRSLEKVAVDKGLVTPDPMTKEASVGESYAPTDDLHEDMLKLVSGLRAKGFTKEADALEDQINTRKFAETHLYRAIDEDGDDLLDFAHPEGDVEVAPSASGLGKVWTEQSAKKEILKIVNKQPTGKNATASLEKTADEEGESFLKHELKARVNAMVEGFEEIWRAKCKGALGSVGQYDMDPWSRGVFRFDKGGKLKTLGDAKKRIFAFVNHYLGPPPDGQLEKKDPKDYFNKIETYMNNKVGDRVHKELGHGRRPWDIVVPLHDYWIGSHSVHKSVKAPGQKSAKYDSTHEKIVRHWQKHLNFLTPKLIDFCVRNKDKCNEDIKTIRGSYIQARTRAGEMWTKRSEPKWGYTLENAQWTVAPILEGEEKGANIDALTSMMAVEFENARAFLKKAGYKVSANNANDITKLGRGFGSKKKTPGGGTPGGTPSSGAGFGMKQGTTRAIQLELQKLAAFGKKGGKQVFHPKVIHILSLPKYGHDNSFGDETKKAIRMAETIRSKYSVKSPGPIAVESSQATLANLKAMLVALNSGKYDSSGQGSGMKQQGAVYDKVPSVLDNSTVVQPGEINVTRGSFASLAVFHAFLLGNGLMQQEFAQGQEMVYMKPLQDTLLWFQKRAQMKAAEKMDPKLRSTAIAYRRDVEKVIRQFITLTQSIYAKYKQLPPWILVDWLSREDFAGRGAGIKPGDVDSGAGSGMKQRRDQGGEDVRIELISGQSGAIKGLPPAAEPPITRYIELRDKRYWSLPENWSLDFHKIGNMDGPTFALTYFSQASTDEVPSLYQLAVSMYGSERVKRQQDGRVYIAPDTSNMKSRRPGQIPPAVLATQDDALMRRARAVAMSHLQSAHPNTRAVNFIRELRSEISKVLNEWSDVLASTVGYKKQRQLSSTISGEASAWQRHLKEMERQIGVDNRKERRRPRR